MITHLEPDIPECEVKWALGSITTNKASGGDGIPVELFQILKDDAVKVLHLVQFSHPMLSDSVQPHRQQPTKLRHPWDSPGKNTGVSCHFLLQCMKVKSLSRV